MDRYVFLVTAVGDGYGGLEHRASTALLCSRDDLPRPGEKALTESYRTFLGLASHEYFHTWNVKRIKPAAFTPYDLDRENYTALLWAFEGVTSYYDDLALVRCGLMTPEEYLEILGRSITQLLRTPGRRRQIGRGVELGRLDQVLPPGRELARTRSSATTGRALWSRCASICTSAAARAAAARSTTSCARSGGVTGGPGSACRRTASSASRRR